MSVAFGIFVGWNHYLLQKALRDKEEEAFAMYIKDLSPEQVDRARRERTEERRHQELIEAINNVQINIKRSLI